MDAASGFDVDSRDSNSGTHILSHLSSSRLISPSISVCVSAHMMYVCGQECQRAHADIRGHLCEAGSLIPPLGGCWESNSGYQIVWQTHLPAELSCWL